MSSERKAVLELSLKKRVVSGLLLVGLLLFTACGGPTESDSASTTTVAESARSFVPSKEILDLVANRAASISLGFVETPLTEGASTLQFQPDSVGLTRISVDGRVVATALGTSSSVFPTLGVPIDLRSTAVSQTLLLSGFLTSDPILDSLLIAIANRSSSVGLVEVALREEKVREGADYLQELDESTTKAIERASSSILNELKSVLAEAKNLRVDNAFNPGLTRPEPPASCDSGVAPFFGLEQDNVCVTIASGQVTDQPSDITVIAENRSPRWVFIYQDSQPRNLEDFSDYVSVQGTSLTSNVSGLVPVAMLKPKRWAIPGVIDLTQRMAAALRDSSLANGAKEIISFIPGVELSLSNDSIAEQLELKLRNFSENTLSEFVVKASTSSQFTSVAPGIPRDLGISQFVNSGYQTDLRRVGPWATTAVDVFVVPLIRIILNLSDESDINETQSDGSEKPSCNVTDDMWRDLALDYAEAAVGNADRFVPLLNSLPSASVESLTDTAAAVGSLVVHIVGSPLYWKNILMQLGLNCKDFSSGDGASALVAGFQIGSDGSVTADELVPLVQQFVEKELKNSLTKLFSPIGKIDQAINVVNFGLTMGELMAEVWKYGTEDVYAFTDASGTLLSTQRWPNLAWEAGSISGRLFLTRDHVSIISSSEVRSYERGTGVESLTRVRVDVSNSVRATNRNDSEVWETSASCFGGSYEFRVVSDSGNVVLTCGGFFSFSSDILVLDRKSGVVRLLARDPDGFYLGGLVAVVLEQAVEVWNPDSGEILFTTSRPSSGSATRQYSLESAGKSVVLNFEPDEVFSVNEDGTLIREGKVPSSDLGERSNLRNKCGDYLSLQDGVLSSFSLATGAPRWRFGDDVDDDILDYVPIEDCSVIIGDNDGRVRRVENSSGRDLWSVEVRLSDRLSPVSGIAVLGNTVLVGSQVEKTLSAFSLDSGELLWRQPFVEGIADLLVDGDGSYYVLTTSGGIKKYSFATVINWRTN